MLGRLQWTLVFLGGIAAAVMAACSVDERPLDVGSGTGAVSNLGGANESGEMGAIGDAASVGGEGGERGGPAEGCLADLNTDRIPDCKQTVLVNGSFATDVKPWTAAPETTLTWDALNALEDAPSGSAKLESSASSASASQCATVQEMQLLIAYGQARVVETAAGSSDSSAELKVSLFASDDCSGDPLGYFETPTSTKVGEWVVVQAGAVSPAGTKSAAVSLVALKAAAAAKVTAYFDNLMLETQPLQ